MTKVYELYHCEYKGKVVYIGQGRKGRHKHCNTGISHVYDLNKIHFNEGVDALKVVVLQEFTEKSDVIELEKKLIDLHRPIFNKVYNSSNNPLNRHGDIREIRNNFKQYADKSEIKLASYDRYLDIMEEFINYVSAKDFKENTITLYSREHYLELGLHNIGKLSRFIRSMGSKDSPKKSPNLLFYFAVKDLYGIDLKECLHTNIK